MTAKILARVLLTLGFLAASVSYSSWIVSRTVLDSAATRSATHALITSPAVRSTLAHDLRDALTPKLGRAASDPQLDAALRAAVADPRFVSAFDTAIANLHDEILSPSGTTKGGQVTLDTRAVTDALRAAVAHRDPGLAKQIRRAGTVSVPLGSDQLPHIGNATRTVGRVGGIAAALAIALVGGALLLVHDRKMIGRVGRRTALLALEPLLAFALVPRLLDTTHGNGEAVASAILRAYGRPVMFSAAAFVVAGVSTWLIALAVPVLRRGRGVPEPPPAPVAAPPRSPRRRRGNEEATAPLPEKLYL